DAIRVTDSEEDLSRALEGLLASPQARERLGQRAEKCFREHLGAGSRYAEVLLQIIQQAELHTARC
ncbi:hypothetical protein EBX31_12805, partial [bacterium]|nr:hypothetical protein [bacterium]